MHSLMPARKRRACLSTTHTHSHPPASVTLQVFFISLFLAIFSYKKEQAWHWVAVGLLVDFCLRFYVRRARQTGA